jgi:hypothetical protein
MDKSSCETIVTAPGGVIQADVSSFTYEFMTGQTVARTRVLLPVLNAGVVEVKPLTILVDFNRNVSGFEKAQPVKKTTASVEFNDRKFVACSNYDAESEKAAYKLSCEMLGGTFIDCLSGTEDCSFAGMDPNSEIFKKAKERICTTVYGGTYLNEKCTSLKMALETEGSNIKPTHFVLSGNSVNTFNQACSGVNEFISKVNSDGSVVCKTVNFCTKCDANCPAGGIVCSGNIVRGSNIAIVDPCAGAPAAGDICRGELLVAGYATCGTGTKDDCFTPPVECSTWRNQDLDILGTGAEYDTRTWNSCTSYIGQTCTSGQTQRCYQGTSGSRTEGYEFKCCENPTTTPTTTTPSPGGGGTCWNITSSNLDSSQINPIGFPNQFWDCSGTKPKSLSDLSGPCGLGETCTYDWKYGTYAFRCEADAGQCPANIENPVEGKADCTYDRPAGWSEVHNTVIHQCNEYFLPTSSPKGMGTLKHGKTKNLFGAKHCRKGVTSGLIGDPSKTSYKFSCNDGVIDWFIAPVKCFCRKTLD